ncbi:class I glutamine amidotransferase-like protein [Schizophyllum commune H4-8]|nr:class I glutamine amidotransferase-like protein [Schizophyllum commune H4-8]KAI5895419.1 class I glutamine amidotransferase-like protein [Schizophyllum commune H4-8]
MASSSLSVAVCMYNRMTSLDYQGPIEFLAALSAKTKPYMFKEKADSLPTLGPFTYLSHTLEPVAPGYAGEAGPRLTPDKTFGEAKEQFDIIMVPGGIPEVPQELNDFLIRQVPGAKYVLTICTGSWVLARTGLLDGKRATGNKFVFKEMLADTASHSIQWVARARWVVDGKFWTSSGVTAGADMASAFVTQIADEATAQTIQNVIEMRAKGQDDDEFAAVFGLLRLRLPRKTNHLHVCPTPDAFSFPRLHIFDAKIERLAAHRTRNEWQLRRSNTLVPRSLIASRFSVFLIHAFTEGRAQDVHSYSVEHVLDSRLQQTRLRHISHHHPLSSTSASLTPRTAMARTFWFLGATGKFYPGRVQFDVWLNERVHPNGVPQFGAHRIVAHTLANNRVYLYSQVYMHNGVTGLVEWVNYFLPPPLTVMDFGWRGPHNPVNPAPPLMRVYGQMMVDDLNPGPLPNGAPRPQVPANGVRLYWHHKTEARTNGVRKMYYIPHTRRGRAYLTKIKIPAGSKGDWFRRLRWATQVQNYRAALKN